jgi:hypothetical protein
MGAKEVIPGLVDDRHLLGAMMALASDSRELIFNLLVSDEEEWLTRYMGLFTYTSFHCEGLL